MSVAVVLHFMLSSLRLLLAPYTRRPDTSVRFDPRPRPLLAQPAHGLSLPVHARARPTRREVSQTLDAEVVPGREDEAVLAAVAVLDLGAQDLCAALVGHTCLGRRRCSSALFAGQARL